MSARGRAAPPRLADALPAVLPQLATLLEASVGVYLALLGRDGTLSWANRALADLLSRGGAEPAGQKLARFVASFDRARLQDALAAAGDAPQEAGLVNFLLEDGAVETLRCSLLPAGSTVLLFGEPTAESNRALQTELLQLNNQLAVLVRENARKGRELQRTVQALSEEVELRTRAEASLRLYQTDLEELVEERTAELGDAHRALRRARVAMDRSKGGVIWVAEDGGIDYANEAAAELTGYSEEELLGLDVGVLWPSQAGHRWRRLWREAPNTGGVEMEAVFRTRAGASLPVEVSANHLSYVGNEYLCCFLRASHNACG